jgi:flagellar hook-associated protein 3 FlgL
MRISDRSMLDEALRQIQRSGERLQATQHRAVTALKVERSSDDPVAYGQITAHSEQLARLEGYNRNITLVRARLSATEASLTDMQGVLTRLRELTMMALNQVTTTESVPIEAEQHYGQLLQMLNQSFGGDYLFSAYAASAPFSGSRFVGDNQKRAVEVSPLGATVFGVSAREAFGVLPGQDAFAAVSKAIAGMRAGNRADVADGLTAIDQHLNMISQAQAILGAQQNTLQVAERANEAYAAALQKGISQARDIDPAQAYSQLAADRYAMEATFAVLGSMSRMSILKYL